MDQRNIPRLRLSSAADRAFKIAHENQTYEQASGVRIASQPCKHGYAEACEKQLDHKAAAPRSIGARSAKAWRLLKACLGRQWRISNLGGICSIWFALISGGNASPVRLAKELAKITS